MMYPTGAGEARSIDIGAINSLDTARWFPDGQHVLICGAEPGHAAQCYVSDLHGPPRAVTPDDVGGGLPGPDNGHFLALARWNGQPLELREHQSGNQMRWTGRAASSTRVDGRRRAHTVCPGRTVGDRLEEHRAGAGRARLPRHRAPRADVRDHAIRHQRHAPCVRARRRRRARDLRVFPLSVLCAGSSWIPARGDPRASRRRHVRAPGGPVPRRPGAATA